MKPTATQTKGIRCISYARFSDDRQKQGTSIERQLDMAKEFVARNKSKGFWLDNESIVDKSRSGAKGENLDPTTGALGRFIQAAKAGKIPKRFIPNNRKVGSFKPQRSKTGQHAISRNHR